MNESLATSAQLTTVQEVDLTRIVKLRNRVKEDFKRREGANLTFLAFIAKATIEALKAYPSLNASISEDNKQVTYHGSVHMGIAVDTPRGLLVPVIKDADDLSLAGIAKKIADVAARTRASKIGRTSCPAAPSRSRTSGPPARCSTRRSSTSPRSPSWAPARSRRSRRSSPAPRATTSSPSARCASCR